MMNRPSLRRWQQAFRRAVQAEGAGPDLHRLGILQTGGVPAKTRLGVYQYAYRARMIESLEEDFPTVQALVGTRNFRRVTSKYLEAHPSRFSSLAEFSRDFCGFLERRARSLGLTARVLESGRRDWIRVLLSREPDPAPTAVALDPDGVIQGRIALSPLVRLCREAGDRDTLLQRRGGDVNERRLTRAETQILRCVPRPTSLAALSRKLLHARVPPPTIRVTVAKLVSENVIVFTENPRRRS